VSTGPDPDGLILRRVRLRLIAWSAGSTLIVLVALGTLLYVAVAQTLATQSTAQLEDRINQILTRQIAQDGVTTPNALIVTNDPSVPGYVFGGTTSGTIAVVTYAKVPPGVTPMEPPTTTGDGVDFPMPDSAQVSAAQNGKTVVWDDSIAGTPVRVVIKAIPDTSGQGLIEAIGDRTAEMTVLRGLLIVLLLGGLAVLAAAVAFGYVYAGRALVPIRDSMMRQRDFAADASHELRTPLAIVRGALDEMRLAPADSAARERSLSDIEAGADRLTHLIDDLLLLARADSGAIELRREKVDLAELATDSTALLGRIAAEHGVRLRIDAEPSPVLGDADRLVQLVGILVDNAIRHSLPGGAVTVWVRPGATLTVDDEGPGIKPDDLPRLFDRFYRAKDAPAGGTGLGLAIASWVVLGHDGRMGAENRPEGGARFTVRIPGVA
jgi:signal transduction histidine kinase